MFVTEKSFKELKNLDVDVRKMIAKIVNQIIDREGVVLYGTVFDDGTFANFTTTQDHNDTHVIMAVGVSEMGILEPIDKGVLKNNLSQDDVSLSKERRIKDLELEVLQLRQLQKAQSAKPSGGHLV